MESSPALLTAPLIESIGWALVHSIWQIALVAALFAVARFALRYHSARLRYALGCIALGAMAMVVAATFCLVWTTLDDRSPAASIAAAPRAVAVEPAIDPIVVPMTIHSESEMPSIPTPTPVVETPPETSPAIEASSSGSPPSAPFRRRLIDTIGEWLPWLVAGWLLGVVGFASRLACGWLGVRRLRRRGITPVAGALEERLVRLSNRLGLDRAAVLVMSTVVEVPAVIGHFRPAILLPVSLVTGLSPLQIDVMLLHELAHIRRHDYLVNLIQTVIETVLFHHPAMWWVSRQVRQERENCCDDMALAVCGDRAAYAGALAAMEELRAGVYQPAVAASGGNLLTRVRRIVGRPAESPGRRHAWLAGMLLLGIILAMTIGVMGATSGTIAAKVNDKQNPSSVERAADDNITGSPTLDNKSITPPSIDPKKDHEGYRIEKMKQDFEEAMPPSRDGLSAKQREEAIRLWGLSEHRIRELMDDWRWPRATPRMNRAMAPIVARMLQARDKGGWNDTEMRAEFFDLYLRKATAGQPVEGLAVTVRPLEETYVKGKPIEVEWKIKNVGDVPRKILWHERQYSPALFGFLRPEAREVFGTDLLRHFTNSLPGPPEVIELAPGEAKTARFDFSRFVPYADVSPGTYQVVGYYWPRSTELNLPKEFLAKAAGEGAMLDRVVAAPVQIKILPREEFEKRLKFKESTWGKPVQDVRARLMVERTMKNLTEGPLFILEVENSCAPLELPIQPQGTEGMDVFLLEIDGQTYHLMRTTWEWRDIYAPTGPGSEKVRHVFAFRLISEDGLVSLKHVTPPEVGRDESGISSYALTTAVGQSLKPLKPLQPGKHSMRMAVPIYQRYGVGNMAKVVQDTDGNNLYAWTPPVDFKIGESSATAVSKDKEKTAAWGKTVEIEIVGKGKPAAPSAVLPDRVSVELIGVARNPSSEHSWWRPDGAPLATAPYAYKHAVFPERPGLVAYEMAFRLTGLPPGTPHSSVRFSVDGSDASGNLVAQDAAGKELQNIRAMVVWMPKDQKETNIDVRVGGGPWRDVFVFAVKSVANGVKLGESVDVDRPVARGDDVIVHWEASLRWLDSRDVDVVIEDAKGNLLHAVGRKSLRVGRYYCTSTFRRTSLEDLVDVHLRERNLNVVRFENVPLRPGAKSAVRTVVRDGANPLGLDDATLVKFFQAGQILHYAAFDCERYYREHDRKLTADVAELYSNRQHPERQGRDPFAPEGPLRLVLKQGRPDLVQVWSVGPDGDWDGGKPIDSRSGTLDGDIGFEMGMDRLKTRWLADGPIERCLEGTRLAHYLAAKGPKRPKPTFKDDGLAWGPVVDGLQLAAELTPAGPYTLGQPIKLRFHVRNAAEYPIQIGINVPTRQDMGQDAVIIQDAEGRRLQGHSILYSGMISTQHRTLEPGQSTTYASSGLALVASGTKFNGRDMVGYWVEAEPGRYSVRLRQRFPISSDIEPKDWQGILETGRIDIQVVDGSKPAGENALIIKPVETNLVNVIETGAPGVPPAS
ncbi:MAG: hypothetical protein JW719_02745 [Pirellulales bacterium]|nr:hypothetical protein [Pirellulales bacterium]